MCTGLCILRIEWCCAAMFRCNGSLYIASPTFARAIGSPINHVQTYRALLSYAALIRPLGLPDLTDNRRPSINTRTAWGHRASMLHNQARDRTYRVSLKKKIKAT